MTERREAAKSSSMTAPRSIPPTDPTSRSSTAASSTATRLENGTIIPASPRRREADYSTVAWALTAVTCFVLAVGIFVIRQVIDTPQRGGPVEEVPLAEEMPNQSDPSSSLLVLRPEKPSSDYQAEENLPMLR